MRSTACKACADGVRCTFAIHGKCHEQRQSTGPVVTGRRPSLAAWYVQQDSNPLPTDSDQLLYPMSYVHMDVFSIRVLVA